MMFQTQKSPDLARRKAVGYNPLFGGDRVGESSLYQVDVACYFLAWLWRTYADNHDIYRFVGDNLNSDRTYAVARL